jgi:hypothetical protein
MGVLSYTVTMDDVLAAQRELENDLGMEVVLELRTHISRGKLLYSVRAHVWKWAQEGVGRRVSEGMASYPTRYHPTFPGACLSALLDAGERANASMWLETLAAQRGEA